MKHEFNVKKYKDATVYTLESASGGGTSAGGIASVSSAMGGVRRRGDNLIAQEQRVEEGKGLTGELAGFLKSNGFKGPYKLGKLPAWYADLGEHFNKDTLIMVQGNDIEYDEFVVDIGYGILYWGAEGGMTKMTEKALVNHVKQGIAENSSKQEAPKPRNFVAKNAKMGGAGQHKDKKKAEKQGDVKHRKPFAEQGVAEEWSQKYKSSINCSHPRGFSQKAHCAGKKKHEESMMTLEAVCPDCGMCQTHGNLNEIKKGAKDSNGYSSCWKGYHAAGTKKGKNGGQVRNCVPNESQGVAEGGYEHGFADPNAPSLDQNRGIRNRDRNAGLEHETNNIQISINGKPWKVMIGKGYADSPEEWQYLNHMKKWAEKKSAATGKKWSVSLTGAPVSEDHSTATQGYGQGGYDTYSNTRHGRGVAENPEWYNDEANSMSSAQLKSLYKHAIKLRKAVKQLQAQGDTLEPWQQSKVTKAADYLDAVFNAVDDEQDMDESWKGKLAGLGLAGAMALGAGGAHARVTGDEDPGVNRLTGKPNVTQVAPDDVKKPDAGTSLGSRYTQGIEFSSEPYTIKADGKEYKFAGRSADNPGKGKVVKVPAALVGVRGLSAVPVTLNPDGKYYMGGDIDENYMEQLAAQLAEKLNPSEPVDTWVQDFQKANPNKYHQFKNKTPAKKAQMAVAAHYAANEPNKK